MKTTGIVMVVLGSISLLGSMIGGNSASGPLFLLGLGIYLIHRANQKKQEQKDKDAWSNRQES